MVSSREQHIEQSFPQNALIAHSHALTLTLLSHAPTLSPFVSGAIPSAPRRTFIFRSLSMFPFYRMHPTRSECCNPRPRRNHPSCSLLPYSSLSGMPLRLRERRLERRITSICKRQLPRSASSRRASSHRTCSSSSSFHLVQAASPCIRALFCSSPRMYRIAFSRSLFGPAALTKVVVS